VKTLNVFLVHSRQAVPQAQRTLGPHQAGKHFRIVLLLTSDLLQDVTLSGSPITALAIDGNYLYALDSGNVLHAIDISGPVMVVHGSVSLPNGGGRLFVANQIAYVGVPDYLSSPVYVGGYVTVDVSNPDQLKVLADIGRFTLVPHLSSRVA
jgi:hypothetical protein